MFKNNFQEGRQATIRAKSGWGSLGSQHSANAKASLTEKATKLVKVIRWMRAYKRKAIHRNGQPVFLAALDN